MKEIIVDFELYENGQVTAWLQNSFQLSMDNPEEGSSCAYEFFHKYANNHWETEGTNLQVRITNIWTVEVE
jgi:hypothetical protein